MRRCPGKPTLAPSRTRMPAWASAARSAPARSPTLAAAGPAHPHYQLVSEEEKQALMEAIRQGSELPVLHVGDWEYQTDMAPLEDTEARRKR